MSKLIMFGRYTLLSFSLCCAASVSLAQICRTESEIPSTTPTSAFTDHGDGTVTHDATGLMWMQCPLGQSGPDCATGTAATYTWGQALEMADTSAFAGYPDWRLPNVNEWQSIVEERCYRPAINQDVFPSTPALDVWSSSPDAVSSSKAWYVDFYNGDSYLNYGSRGYYKHVRLVRSGQ